MLGSYLDLGNPVGDSPLNDKLASWWLALPGRQGYKFLDLRGAYHGTLTGGPSWVGGGRPGGWGALSFDGTDDYVDAGSPAALDVSGSFTLSVWLQAPASFSGAYRNVAYKGTAGTAGVGRNYGVAIDAAAAASGFWLQINGVAGLTDDITSSVALVAARWHHLCLTYDQSSRTRTLYVDARQGHQQSGSSGSPTPGTEGLWVGRGTGGFGWLNSAADDLRLHNGRALSAAEVYALYEDSARGHPLTLRRFTRRSWLMSPPAAGGAQTATPGAADVTVSGLAPAASGTGTAAATPGVAAVTVSGIAPAASASGAVTVTPGVAAIAVSGVAPSAAAAGSVTAAPGVAAVAVSGVSPAAAGAGAATATPGAAVVAVSGVAPSASAGFSTAAPGAAAVTVAGLAPAASAPGVARATPGVGTVTVSALAPSAVPGPVTLSPGVGAAAVTALAPAASPAGPATAAPGAGAVAVAGANPDASGASAVLLAPGAAAVAVTAVAPEAGFPGIRPTFRRQAARGRSGGQVVRGRDADQRVRGV